jgi:hypothetical protein
MSLYIITLSYRSWVKPLMHLLLSLPTLLYSYLNRFRIKYCLALLRPVAIGDFRSPAIITMCWWKIGDQTEKLEATRQGSGVLLVFRLCRLRTDRCSSLLSRWTHASHLPGRIKYISTAKLVTLFRPGSTWVHVLVLKGYNGDAKSEPKVHPGCHWWSVAHFSGWVWFVWGINHQLVRNRFESLSLLDSEHLTRVTAS